MDKQKQKIYQINERTLTQLNQDRHLAAKAIEHLLEQKDQEYTDKIEKYFVVSLEMAKQLLDIS